MVAVCRYLAEGTRHSGWRDGRLSLPTQQAVEHAQQPAAREQVLRIPGTLYTRVSCRIFCLERFSFNEACKCRGLGAPPQEIFLFSFSEVDGRECFIFMTGPPGADSVGVWCPGQG